jgi:aminoglycoside 6'-N-acetyltransferase
MADHREVQGLTDLHGDSVVLRSLRFADAARLREIHAEPAVAAWWGSMDDEFPFDEPEATRFTIWVDGQVAGLIQYGEEDEPDYRHAWIDLFVATAFHGRGVGTDAVKTVARHLVEERGHHRLTIDPSVGNTAAVRAYEKAGFERVGVMRLAERSPEGTWRDAHFMEQVFPSVVGLTPDEGSP